MVREMRATGREGALAGGAERGKGCGRGGASQPAPPPGGVRAVTSRSDAERSRCVVILPERCLFVCCWASPYEFVGGVWLSMVGDFHGVN
jgi:hypothetical protein